MPSEPAGPETTVEVDAKSAATPSAPVTSVQSTVVDTLPKVATERPAGYPLCEERAQKFFEDYALQVRKPHFGPVHREVIIEMLKRAVEANLYTPKE